MEIIVTDSDPWGPHDPDITEVDSRGSYIWNPLLEVIDSGE